MYEGRGSLVKCNNWLERIWDTYDYINGGSHANFLQATVDVSPLKVRHYKGGSCFVQPVNGKQVSLDCL